MSYNTLQIKSEEHVTWITIDREKQLNALSAEVISELQRLLNHDVPQSCRVIVLTGAGDKAFVAGADIAEMSTMTPLEAKAFAEAGQRLTRTLESLPQVTIARVQGYALGGGCELAMACDLIIASGKAKFGQPEVNLGLVAGFGGTQRLVHRIGMHKALDLLLCGNGRTLSGEEAHSVGLVSRVTSPEDLDLEVGKTIKAILKAGPSAIALTKQLCRNAASMSLDAGLAAEAAGFATTFAGEEAKEGTAAFLGKRPPGFSVKFS